MYSTSLVISVMAVRVDESNSRFSLAFFHPTTGDLRAKMVLEVFGSYIVTAMLNTTVLGCALFGIVCT